MVKLSGSATIAKIAAEVRTVGHFNKIIVSIDEIIDFLRKEEAADIEHRDRNKIVTKNSNDLEDLGHSIHKTRKKINRLGDQQPQLQDEVSSLKTKNCTH